MYESTGVLLGMAILGVYGNLGLMYESPLGIIANIGFRFELGGISVDSTNTSFAFSLGLYTGVGYSF